LFSYEWYLSMILKNIKNYLQNICNNDFIINTICKTQISFNIVFIQESSWSFIHLLHSLKNCEGEELVEVSNHLNWIIFSRNLSNIDDLPRVITYINIRLSQLHYSLLMSCKPLTSIYKINTLY